MWLDLMCIGIAVVKDFVAYIYIYTTYYIQYMAAYFRDAQPASFVLVFGETYTEKKVHQKKNLPKAFSHAT